METGTDGARKSDYLVRTATDKRGAGVVGRKDTWDCPSPSSLVSQRPLGRHRPSTGVIRLYDHTWRLNVPPGDRTEALVRAGKHSIEPSPQSQFPCLVVILPFSDPVQQELCARAEVSRSGFCAPAAAQ